MLKQMRDSFHHLKWVLIAVVAAFVFGFVFIDMGLGGSAGGSGSDTDQAYAARVNGETISYNDYYRALKNYEDMYRQMYGGQFTPEMAQQMGLPRQVLDTLVDQRLLSQEARRLHLTATPEEVRRKILQIPTFNPEGKFVGHELYRRYITGPMGYPSEFEFEQDLAREISLGKIESALENSVVVSAAAAENEFRRVSENAKIRYVLLPATREAANVTVSPAEVEAYYRANQSKYQHGEQRQVRYLLADTNRLRAQIVPTDAQLRQRYEASKEEFKSTEAARVLHILVKVDPAAAPAVDLAAKAKAEGIVRQLRAGADFAALATQSDDPSSSSKGGDMGWVDRGVTVPEFENAIFSLPLNTVGDPIRSKDFGYHIVKVTARRPAGYRPFEEAKAELTARVADEMAKEQARNEINRIATQLRDNKPKNVEAFVAYANQIVSSNDTGWFQKSEPIPGLGQNQPLSNWAFTAAKGDVGEVVGTQRGMVIPYVADVRGAGVTSLTEIRAKVEEDARQAKAATAAQTKLAAAVAGAPSVDVVGAKVGMQASEVSVNRQGFVAGFSGDTSALVDAAMSAKLGEVKGPINTGDGAVVFQVIEQKKVTPQELAQNRDQYLGTLRQQQARNLRQVLVQRLRKESKIDVNEKLLQAPEQQQAGL
jgi:peptidyl-prolyl cis-trans isomerase D